MGTGDTGGTKREGERRKTADERKARRARTGQRGELYLLSQSGDRREHSKGHGPEHSNGPREHSHDHSNNKNGSIVIVLVLMKVDCLLVRVRAAMNTIAIENYGIKNSIVLTVVMMKA